MNTVRIEKYSEIYNRQKLNLFTRVLTAKATDPIRTTTNNRNTLQEWEEGLRRAGRPRNSWTKMTTKQLWQTTSQGTRQLDLSRTDHQQALLDAAENYRTKHEKNKQNNNANHPRPLRSHRRGPSVYCNNTHEQQPKQRRTQRNGKTNQPNRSGTRQT